MNNITNTEEFERCVICGTLTGISVSTPIDFRNFYEVGFGQLCVTCHKNCMESQGISPEDPMRIKEYVAKFTGYDNR